MNRRIAVMGAGSWGTALSVTLAGNGHDVFMWDINEAHLAKISADRENKQFLPEVKLPSAVKISDHVSSLFKPLDSKIFSRYGFFTANDPDNVLWV